MMKEEFETLIGFKVNDAVWAEVEWVYMNHDAFESKQDMADFFKKFDYCGVHGLYVGMQGVF